MNSVTELATQIANELGAAEMLQGPYLDAVPIITRSLTAYSLALTAAVRRKDASEVIRCQSAPGVWADSPDAVAAGILALIKLQEQSALDDYRDSVVAAERERTLEEIAKMVEGYAYYMSTITQFGETKVQENPYADVRIIAKSIRALKGSSDAAIDEAKWQGESQAHSEERAFRKALNSPAQVSYPCGCTASEGSPRYCPEHSKRRERSGD